MYIHGVYVERVYIGCIYMYILYIYIYTYIYIYIYNSNNGDVVHGNRIDKTDLNYLAFTFSKKQVKKTTGKEKIYCGNQKKANNSYHNI